MEAIALHEPERAWQACRESTARMEGHRAAVAMAYLAASLPQCVVSCVRGMVVGGARPNETMTLGVTAGVSLAMAALQALPLVAIAVCYEKTLGARPGAAP